MLNTFKNIFKWSIHCNRLHRLMGRNGNAVMLETFAYHTVVHFTYQNWISKPSTVFHDCIRYVMVCKIVSTNWNTKIALLRAFTIVSYYIKLFRTEADRDNYILMSLLLLVTETKSILHFYFYTRAGWNSSLINSIKSQHFIKCAAVF